MRMRYFLFIAAILGILIFPYVQASHATLLNGDFSSGLNGWRTEGDVQVVNEEAILGDNNEFYSALYQGVALVPFIYTIEFDFKNALSDVPDMPGDPFAFLDTFFASLYFIDDLDQFNLAASAYDDTLALFDLDASGVFNNNGTIGASAKGADWFHFSMTFDNTYNYVIPTFELFDFNFIDNDSQVFLDNVSMNPVPEPATIVLLGSGLLGLGGVALRRRVSNTNASIMHSYI